MPSRNNDAILRAYLSPMAREFMNLVIAEIEENLRVGRELEGGEKEEK